MDRLLNRLPALLLIVMAVLTPGAQPRAGGPFPSENVTLLSQVALEDFPGAPIRGNDCWGYVSPSGREYALMGLYNEVAVVEVTNPSSPVVVAEIPHTPSNWADIKVWKDHAYAVNEAGGGLDVIDLSQVDSGTVTLVQRITVGGLQTTHNIAVDTTSGFLYLCDANINGGRLVAFDLTDPSNPVLAGQMDAIEGTDVHDVQVVTYPDGPYAGRQIAFASVGGEGIDIYDVTDKNNMFRLSRSTYPNLSFAHQAWTGDLQYLYVNDELDGINESVIFDITDLAQPVFVGTYSAGIEAIDHNLYVHDGFIYESDYAAGLRIFDATDPVLPVQVGWFDVYPDSDAAASVGSWSNYPFFPSGNVLISAKEEGLFVVRPGPPPLVFTYPAGTPARVDPSGEGFLVEIAVEDGLTLDPGSPQLHYDAGAGWLATPMTSLGGGLFEATFGAVGCPALIRFYVSASTTSGIELTDPISAPSPTHLAVSGTFVLGSFEDDMEVDRGWIAGGPGDTAAEGIWTRVDPNGNRSAPESDHTLEPGVTAYVTGQEPPSSNEGDNDVDGGATTLISPVFDLAGAEDVIASYWRWFDNDFFQIDGDEGNGPNEDVFVVEISNDGGGSWFSVETVGPAGAGTEGGWILHWFDVNDHIAPTSQVRLRFVASDFGNLSVIEAGVDDFQIVSVVCGVLDCNDNAVPDEDEMASCGPAEPWCQDCNGNGLLDECDDPFPQQGTVALDRTVYGCESPVTIVVSDCGPNLDPGATDSLVVTAGSDTEPAGEVVTLTETNGDSGSFEGVLSVSSTDGPGVLAVGNGDTIQVQYLDADDGSGGMSVPRTATATVDCLGPLVFDVGAGDPGAFSATVSFSTDEPATATVRYGTDCVAPTGQADDSQLKTTFALPLAGLMPETTYYFVIDAVDGQGNAATFDNGGSCFSFQTSSIPNYFTEQFVAADNDMDFRSVLFTPDGSSDYYAPCTEGTSSLPTDPAGGSPLTLGLDDFVTVQLPAGMEVSLYGRAYGTVHVGSNGYLTFETGDTDWSETLAEHFDQPRVSAHFDDLDVRNQGSVSWRLLADRLAVTYEDVPEYLTSNSNTFQVEMFFDGRIRLSYLGIASTDGLAGLSDGTGLLPAFTQSDLSGLAVCAAGAGPPAVPGTMTVDKLDAFGDQLLLVWEAAACGAVDHMILYGNGSQLPQSQPGSFVPGGSVCGIGTVSPFEWNPSPDAAADPSGLVWWMVVATDGATTEGSWGRASNGVERAGQSMDGASAECGVTDKDVSNLCGQ